MISFMDLIVFNAALLLLCQLIPAAAAPFTKNTTSTYNGTHLSVEAWHAQSLTEISWNLQGSRSAHHRDKIIVYWDALSTAYLRFRGVNETNRYGRHYVIT